MKTQIKNLIDETKLIEHRAKSIKQRMAMGQFDFAASEFD